MVSLDAAEPEGRPRLLLLARFNVVAYGKFDEGGVYLLPPRSPETAAFSRLGASVGNLYLNKSERLFLEAFGRQLSPTLGILQPRLKYRLAVALRLPPRAFIIRVTRVDAGSVSVLGIEISLDPKGKWLRRIAAAALVLGAISNAEDVIIKAPETWEAIEKLQHKIYGPVERSVNEAKHAAEIRSSPLIVQIHRHDPDPKEVLDVLQPFLRSEDGRRRD